MPTPSRFPDASRRVARYRAVLSTTPDWLALRARAMVTPRYRAGEVKLAGRRIAYPDLHAVMAQFHDIFRRRIYHFHTGAAAPRIIDAGGFVGMSALYFKSVYPVAAIDTFEPDPALVTLIRRNLDANGIEGVTVHQAAVGETAGEAAFVSDGADGGALVDPGPGRLAVPTVTLADVIDSPVDFLKLDIEGSELPALRGAGDALRHVDQLVLEYHGGTEDERQDLGPLLQLLDEHGFRYLVNHADYFVNPFVRPPFLLRPQTQWTALVYGRRRR